MSKCIILGAGASYGYDDTLEGLSKPPLTDDLFIKGFKLELFQQKKYPRLYEKLKSHRKISAEQALGESISKIDVEVFMEWLVEQFEKPEGAIAPNADPETISRMIRARLDYQAALGEMWFLVFEVIKHYSASYKSNFDNYQRLALHYRSEPYSVITLNYDTIFELAILYSSGMYNYLPPTPPTSIPIAKIHGSVNWLNPSGRGISIGNVERDKVLFSIAQFIYSNRTHMEPPVIVDPRSLSVLKMEDLLRSGTDYLVPALIPPLGNHKDYEQVALYKQVWQFAEYLLSDASELVIIGTRLREQDKHLCELIKKYVKQETRVVTVGNKKAIQDALERILGFKKISDESYDCFTQFARTL